MWFVVRFYTLNALNGPKSQPTLFPGNGIMGLNRDNTRSKFARYNESATLMEGRWVGKFKINQSVFPTSVVAGPRGRGGRFLAANCELVFLTFYPPTHDRLLHAAVHIQ